MPPRLKVTLIDSKNNEIVDPLIVVVRHRSGVISWQLPYIQKTQEIRYMHDNIGHHMNNINF